MQTLLHYFQSGANYVFSAVILLGVLIFVHELGHFLVARFCGVRVEVFSLGFGKKIWKVVRGDTTYCVSIIPLGGYVKMYGDQPNDDVPDSLKAVSFTHKTVWQRISIVLAGPLMNCFFAILIFAVVGIMGVDQRSPQFGDIEQNSPAWSAGLRSGDRILSINSVNVKSLEDAIPIFNKNIGSQVSLEIERDNQIQKILAPIISRDNPNPLSLSEKIGVIEGADTESIAPIIGLKSNSLLRALGIKTGDVIKSINGTEITKYSQISSVLLKNQSSPTIQFEIERYTEGVETPEKLSVNMATPKNISAGAESFGITSADVFLAKIIPDSPAEKAGLVAGDQIIKVNDLVISKWDQVLNSIKNWDEKNPIQITVVRNGKELAMKVTPQMTNQVSSLGTNDKRFTIGIVPTIAVAMPEIVTIKQEGVLTALAYGARQTYDFSIVTVLSFVRLFQNKISPKSVGGLISIGQAAGETMKMGLNKFLSMMAIISVNLFILNLLPVPVLDGGHLVFYTIEVLKGSPLSLKKMEMAQQVGLVLLMSLMVFALFNDFSRLLGKL